MTAPPSLLTARRETLLPWVALAGLGHTLAAAGLWYAHQIMPTPDGPLIDPQDTIEVSMVALPKAQDRLPDRASRAPVPTTPEPAPEPAPTPEPPPPEVSDLAVPSEEPDPTQPAEEADEQRVVEQDRKLDDLLGELADAPEGSQNRSATSLEGSEDAASGASSSSGRHDPELARYIARVSKLFVEHFRPLPTLKGQGLVAVVSVQVNEDGRVTDRRIEVSSGNPSWDRSAMSAAEAVGRIPPPPERYRDDPSHDYLIRFEDPG